MAALGEHRIVQRFVGSDGFAVAHHLGAQHAPLGDAMFAAEGALQFRVNIVDGDGGEKSQAAQIDGKQRDLALADGARGREQRAVAAQHDHQVAAFGHIGARNAGSPPA